MVAHRDWLYPGEREPRTSLRTGIPFCAGPECWNTRYSGQAAWEDVERYAFGNGARHSVYRTDGRDEWFLRTSAGVEAGFKRKGLGGSSLRAARIALHSGPS